MPASSGAFSSFPGNLRPPAGTHRIGAPEPSAQYARSGLCSVRRRGALRERDQPDTRWRPRPACLEDFRHVAPLKRATIRQTLERRTPPGRLRLVAAGSLAAARPIRHEIVAGMGADFARDLAAVFDLDLAIGDLA